MSRVARVMSLLIVPALFAACSPGATDTPLSPAAPRHDGGLLVGGNYVPPDTTTQGTTTTSTTSSSDGLDSGATDSTSRSGLLVGGN